jgi:hypothetical protein
MDDIDPGPTPPPWTEPGAQPDRDSVANDGTTVLSWTRDVSAVWIAADDTVEGSLLNASTESGNIGCYRCREYQPEES